MTFLKSPLLVLLLIASQSRAQQAIKAQLVSHPDNASSNSYYLDNKMPLLKKSLIRLPVNTIHPGGWVRKVLELQQNGLAGNLGEISIWLSKKDNAWLNKEGKGKYGWEELPYWLKGYANIGYMLGDEKMISESKFWINAVLNNQRTNGDFGPDVVKEGKRDLWTNMPMLWCLQSYYEYSADTRVLPFMTRYFKWQLSLPDSMFLKDYWENSRGGDNLQSVYWLYNHTGEKFLLELATKIDRNTANWRQKNDLPNWHNVNIAQCFREPAQYYQQSKIPGDLEASYHNFQLIRSIYGQVPGGMFGADENARKGYDDPRQAMETCGMVEQITSDNMMTEITGDPFWADNAEDVAFNMFSAAFTPDYKALRYLTAPNMAISDSMDHSPGIENNGPYLMMNPFSSRCCQHNHTAGWVYYAENSWMATPDNGLAAILYFENEVKAKLGNGKDVTIKQSTHYPFDDQMIFTIQSPKPVQFPLYLRIPEWCTSPVVKVNDELISIDSVARGYVKISKLWKAGDKVSLQLPMELTVRQWKRNKNSVSINYGPLTYSLKIEENYVERDSRATAQHDSRWQEGVDTKKWPSYEIYPSSDWNYGLVLDTLHPEKYFTVIRKNWPSDNSPFTNVYAPIEIKAKGRKIPSWKIDQYGLTGILPMSPVATNEPTVDLVLVPMGGSRLRISAFPLAQ